jgi:sporulation protein YlmC with PRC-barrel domain
MEPQVALGLTERQLRDADIVAANGQELGEVEELVRGPNGAVTQLLIEVEDSNPDHYVHIPLDGLTRVQDGNDWDLRSNATRDQLMALPAVDRRRR